jgi:hypothetical protein
MVRKEDVDKAVIADLYEAISLLERVNDYGTRVNMGPAWSQAVDALVDRYPSEEEEEEEEGEEEEERDD